MGAVLKSLNNNPRGLVGPLDKANYLVNFSQKFGYVYVETPKVACTSIKRLLQLVEAGGDESALPADVHDRPNSPLPRMNDDKTAFNRFWSIEDPFLFCFVRDPFARVLSCYLDKYIHQRSHISMYMSNIGTPSSRRITFRYFLDAVHEQEPSARNVHYTSQSYITNPNKLPYDFIGRFERFRSDMQYVCNKLNIDSSLLPIRSSHRTNSDDKLRAFYGAKEIELVNEIYDEDFINFGYPRDPLRVATVDPNLNAAQ